MLQQAQATPSSGVPEHQLQVDELLAAIRAEGATVRRPIFTPPLPAPDRSSEPLDHWIAEEIECIRRHLDLLGDTLSSDPMLIHRHGRQLQSIDRMGQLLGHLARVIEAEKKEVAIERITLQDLRARLKCKPLGRFGR